MNSGSEVSPRTTDTHQDTVTLSRRSEKTRHGQMPGGTKRPLNRHPQIRVVSSFPRTCHCLLGNTCFPRAFLGFGIPQHPGDLRQVRGPGRPYPGLTVSCQPNQSVCASVGRTGSSDPWLVSDHPRAGLTFGKRAKARTWGQLSGTREPRTVPGPLSLTCRSHFRSPTLSP